MGRANFVGKGKQQLTKLEDEKVKLPSKYKVVLVNDDFTPMDFVVDILRKHFAKTEAQAVQTMLEVHIHGRGICGIYTFDIAETKVAIVNDCAKNNQYPLLCQMEEA